MCLPAEVLRDVLWVVEIFKAALIHDCSPNPVFFFLYSKILPVTRMI